VDVESWRELLTRWNAEMLDTPDLIWRAPDYAVASGWLGCPPASEEQIRAAEARIGTQLPPSYRSFLQASNGWQHLDYFHWHLWSADEIDWFRVRNQDWIDAYVCYLDPGNGTVRIPYPTPNTSITARRRTVKVKGTHASNTCRRCWRSAT
jgi:hypothetical protein